MYGQFTAAATSSYSSDRISSSSDPYYVSSPLHQRRPLPAYAQSGPAEPMGMIQSPRYTYAVNAIPSPLYTSQTTDISRPQRFQYKHNKTVAAILLPTGILLLSRHPSNLPVISFLILALIIYALDLIHSRDGVLYTTWCAVPVLSLTTGWSWLMEEDADANDSTDYFGWTVIHILFHTLAVALYWSLVAAWGTLQFTEWATAHPTMSRQLETCLHATAPLTIASLLSHISVQYLNTTYGPDVAATAAPFILAVLFWLGMIALGSSRSSFPTNNSGEMSKSSEKELMLPFIVSNAIAQGQLMVLLLLPPSMHLMTFWRRLTSRMADFDDWFDWFLSLAIPYLLMISMKVLTRQKIVDTPYAKLPLLRQSTVLPLIVVFLTSLAIQQRYLIPFVHELSYQYTGTKQSSWMLCLYWTLATITLLLTTWLWGRTSQGRPFLGEYHEDALQVLLSFLGLFLGKGVGMPWNFAPLPILAFLGICLWLTTCLLRYLGIVVFVFLATAFVTFTYRFAGIDHTLALPFPINKSVSLIGFSMAIVTTSALFCFLTGLAVRAPGGFLSRPMKRFDLTGMCLITYTILLMEMEIALIKRESTWKNMIGVHMTQDATISDVLYTPELAYVTSVALVGVSYIMEKFDMINMSSFSIAIAFSLAKALSIYIDNMHYEQNMHLLSPTDTFFDAVLAGISFVIMVVPHAFLQPVYLKASTRYQRSISGGPVLTMATRRTIFIYAFLALPFAIILAEFAVVEPLVEIVLSNSNWSITGGIVLVLGTCMCMWGLSLLSMLNHYLPDGGAEFWKKISGSVFLLGAMMCCTFPMFGSASGKESIAWNPYKLVAVSTLGRNLARRSRSRTGGYGILSSLIATLLALMGPLELRERRNKSGGKDQLLLLRTTIFSLLFGGGVAWFVTVQIMSESDSLVLIFTTISSMMMAFLCTVASVLGYYVELENFAEVEQLANTVMVAFIVFFLTAAIPVLLTSSTAFPFVSAGWLATYLFICGMSFLLISVCLGQRKVKDIRTRGVANWFCLLAWMSILAVIFGKFGVAGLDENYEFISLFGPISILGTLAASPMLLFLEGEVPSTGAGRRLAGTNKSSLFSLSMPLHQLRKSNCLFPPFCGTVGAFLVASVYVNLLRGSGFLSFGHSVPPSRANLLDTLLSPSSKSGDDTGLSVLAEQTILLSHTLKASARLAGSGIWTSDSMLSPILHFVGICCTLPSLYLAMLHWWLRFGRRSVGGILNAPLPPMSSQLVCLSAVMNIFPIIFARGISTLQASAYIQIFVGVVQILAQQQASSRASQTDT